MRSGQAKWTSIALVIDFYGHLDMILDTTFARLAKLTWMINDGGRPGEVHRTGKQKETAPDNQVIEEEAPPDGYEPSEEILKGLVRSLGRELKKDLSMLGYPRFRDCPLASTRAGGRLPLGNRPRFPTLPAGIALFLIVTSK